MIQKLLNLLGSIPIQVWVVILVFGGSALSAVVKQLRARAEARRIDQLRRRAQAEAMRTGRVSAQGTPGPVAGSQPAQQSQEEQERRERLEELAAKRKAQLEELRRRRAAQQARTRTGPARTPPASSTPPQAQRPAQVQTQPQTSGPPERSRTQAEAARKRQLLELQRRRDAAIKAQQSVELAARAAAQAEAERAARLADREREEGLRIARESAVRRASKLRRETTGVRALLRSPGGIRSAFVLTEVLGTPVGSRPPRGQAGNPGADAIL